MTDDIKLLRRYIQDGSQEAFTELVRLRINFVYAWALRRVGGNVHSAQDVTQQVFIELARNASSLSERETLAGWLYTTARFTAAKHARSWRRQQLREQNQEVVRELYGQPTLGIDSEELRPALAELMDKLSERDREAVLLRFFACHDFAEIGAMLGVTEEGARSRVQRALDKMRRLLASHGIKSSAAALELALASQALVAAPAGLAASIAESALTALPVSGTITHPILNLLNLMTKNKMMATAAGALALLTTGALVYKARKVFRLEGAVASVQKENDDLELRQLSLEKSIRESASANSALQRQAPATSANADVGIGHLKPAFSDSRYRLMKARLGMKYGPLFYALKFSPSQIEKVTALMAKNGLELNDIYEVAKAQGIPLDDPGLATTWQRSQAQLNTDLQDILSPSDYQQLHEYSRTVYLRTEVAGYVAEVVSDTGAPLTAGQADQLTQILASHSPSYVAGGEASTDVAWTAVLADAQAILTPAEMTALQQRQVYLEEVWKAQSASNSPKK